MIKKLIAKHREKKLKKEEDKLIPTFGDLYVGELVYIDWKGVFQEGYLNYHVVQKCIICKKIAPKHYVHIKSNKLLLDANHWAQKTGNYAIIKPRKFTKVFSSYIKWGKYDKSTKINENAIPDIEDKMNSALNDINNYMFM